MPEGGIQYPVEVRFGKADIALYLPGYKFRDERLATEVDFYDIQQGLIRTESELVIRRNPAFPVNPYAWMADCTIKKVLSITQRQSDVRTEVKLSIEFLQEKAGAKPFIASVRNLSAGGLYMETVQELEKDELLDFNFCFGKSLRPFTVRTVWAKHTDDGRFGYGMQFVGLKSGAEASIRQFVFREIQKEHLRERAAEEEERNRTENAAAAMGDTLAPDAADSAGE